MADVGKYKLLPCSRSTVRSSSAVAAASARSLRFGASSRRTIAQAPMRTAAQTIAGGVSAARSCNITLPRPMISGGRPTGRHGHPRRPDPYGELPAPGTLPAATGRSCGGRRRTADGGDIPPPSGRYRPGLLEPEQHARVSECVRFHTVEVEELGDAVIVRAQQL